MIFVYFAIAVFLYGRLIVYGEAIANDGVKVGMPLLTFPKVRRANFGFSVLIILYNCRLFWKASTTWASALATSKMSTLVVTLSLSTFRFVIFSETLVELPPVISHIPLFIFVNLVILRSWPRPAVAQKFWRNVNMWFFMEPSFPNVVRPETLVYISRH